MSTIRGCLAASRLLSNSIKPYINYAAIRYVYASPQSDERVEILRELFRRKQEAGPEKPVHRSKYLEWNYQAELYAFSKRISENFSENLLETAFTQRSYVLHQESMQKELGLDDPKRYLEDNYSLAEKGEQLSRNFVARYLRTALPRMPEEGIQTIRAHLLREDNLSNIIINIGADELILCTDFPTEVQTKVSTFYALVGAIKESSGEDRGALFVRDFIIASLSGQDIQSLVEPENKLEAVNAIFLREGKEVVEARLIAQVGINTIIPAYRVGLYSDKKHIATGDGESIDIAVENAAVSLLWKLWGIPDGKFQFPYQLDVNSVLANSKTNVPECEWTVQKAAKADSR